MNQKLTNDSFLTVTTTKLVTYFRSTRLPYFDFDHVRSVTAGDHYSFHEGKICACISKLKMKIK